MTHPGIILASLLSTFFPFRNFYTLSRFFPLSLSLSHTRTRTHTFILLFGIAIPRGHNAIERKGEKMFNTFFSKDFFNRSQGLPTFFLLAYPKTRTDVRINFLAFILTNLNFYTPFRFLTYPWGYAYHRFGTADRNKLFISFNINLVSYFISSLLASLLIFYEEIFLRN